MQVSQFGIWCYRALALSVVSAAATAAPTAETADLSARSSAPQWLQQTLQLTARLEQQQLLTEHAALQAAQLNHELQAAQAAAAIAALGGNRARHEALVQNSPLASLRLVGFWRDERGWRAQLALDQQRIQLSEQRPAADELAALVSGAELLVSGAAGSLRRFPIPPVASLEIQDENL